MNIKETIKKDWHVDAGIIFFIILIMSAGFSGAYHNVFIIFGTYIGLVLLSCFLDVADEPIMLFFFPFLPILFWEAVNHDKRIKKYIKDVGHNVHKTAIVILAHYDRYHFKYTMKPNYDIGNIKNIVEYLKRKRGNDFSFYDKASVSDVESIMSDEKVREVLFVGHGDSHVFVLSLDDEIYYCDFNDKKYHKDYVHQVHCGHGKGKHLSDYVIPKENADECFLPDKIIRARSIDKWFKAH
jgi:hypothetical protein